MDENTINNEINGDIEEIARRCVAICEEKKASNILLFDVRENSIIADYYLVCSGNSMAHIRALADNLRRTLISEGFKSRGREGTPASQWIVLDFGVILIHIMTPEMRRHYCLEDLWDERLIVFRGGEAMPAASIPAEDEEDTYGQWGDEDDEEWEDEEDEEDWEDEEDEEDEDKEDVEWDGDEEDEEDEDDEDDEDEEEDEEEDWDDEEDWDEEEDDWDEDDDDDDEDEAPVKPKRDGGITPKDIFGDDDEDDGEDDGAIKIPVTQK